MDLKNLPKGTEVVLQSLKKQEYNGIKGKIVKYDYKTRRYDVRLDGKKKKIISFKAENLTLTGKGMQALNLSPSSLMRILFFGNPGTGKSTIINAFLLGLGVTRPDYFCESGLSFLTGLTKEAKEIIVRGLCIIDTPGLDDIETRKDAAKEIEKMLKKTSSFKIIFVLMLDGLRVRDGDMTTVNVVMEALERQKVVVKYSLIVNKTSEDALKFVSENEDGFAKFFGLFHTPPTKIGFFMKVDAAHDKKNYLIPVENQKLIIYNQRARNWAQHKGYCLKDAMEKFPTTAIQADLVDAVNIDRYEDMKTYYEAEIKKVLEEQVEQKQKMEEQKQKMEELILDQKQKMEERVEEQEIQKQKMEQLGGKLAELSSAHKRDNDRLKQVHERERAILLQQIREKPCGGGGGRGRVQLIPCSLM